MRSGRERVERERSWDPLSWYGRLSHSDAALEEDLASQVLEESSSFLCSE
jgi:hypothetical protein